MRLDSAADGPRQSAIRPALGLLAEGRLGTPYAFIRSISFALATWRYLLPSLSWLSPSSDAHGAVSIGRNDQLQS